MRLLRLWKKLGPGLITGAADNDPSGIATYSIAGARFGFVSLWTLLYLLPFMIAIQSMCARIGALSGCGLAGNIRRHYPAWLLLLAAASLVAANIFNIGADVYGMAGAVNLIFPVGIQTMAIIMSLGIMALVIVLRYRQIEMIFKWLALSLLLYGAALIVVHPDWGTILLRLVVPTIHFDREYIILLFAILGTTISPYLFFWQASQEAEEIRQDRPNLKVCKYRTVKKGVLTNIDRDTRIGMTASNTVSFCILALAASTLFIAGQGDIQTLQDAARALEPLAGPYAFWFFALGIIGSGLLAIPVLAGSAAYVVAEIMGWQASLDKPFNRARQFYIVMVAAVALGMLLPFIGITPVQALYLAALVNGLVAPLLVMLIIHMANNPAIVGEHRSSPLVHALGFATLFLLLTGSVFVVAS